MVKVLTVDDSATMRDMVCHTLRSAGYEAVEAEDGEKALDVLAREKIDLIITDLNMPKMDGYTLIEQARAQAAYKYTPILMLTTESDAQKKDRARSAGATGWIVKPFHPEKLVQVVAKVCGQN